ncbi:MAG: nucleotidyltransferase domain-containing protein [Candidatus Hydrogenedentota bacterium]
MDSSVIESVKQYADIVRTYIPVKKIIIYGSYAKGIEIADSDIDVAVVVDDIHRDYLDVSATLITELRALPENSREFGLAERIYNQAKQQDDI